MGAMLVCIDECTQSCCRIAAHPGALKAGADVVGVCLGHVQYPYTARQDMKIHTLTHHTHPRGET